MCVAAARAYFLSEHTVGWTWGLENCVDFPIYACMLACGKHFDFCHHPRSPLRGMAPPLLQLQPTPRPATHMVGAGVRVGAAVFRRLGRADQKRVWGSVGSF